MHDNNYDGDLFDDMSSSDTAPSDEEPHCAAEEGLRNPRELVDLPDEGDPTENFECHCDEDDNEYLHCVPYLAPRRVSVFSTKLPQQCEKGGDTLFNGYGEKLEPQNSEAPHNSNDAAPPVLVATNGLDDDDKSIFQASLESLFREVPRADIPTLPICSYLLRNELGVASGEFREGQQEVVLSILQGQSTLAVFPTGWGKTLCFQVPMLIHRLLFEQKVRLWKQLHVQGNSLGVSPPPQSYFGVVVSPLLSLMADQMAKIAKDGCLKAVVFSSATSGPREKELLSNLETSNSSIDLLFVSPEKVVRHRQLREVLRRQTQRIAFICIDEAHCVSQWAYDFRPSFMYVHRVLEDIFSDGGCTTPFLCLTATATSSVIEDMQRLFNIKRTVVVSHHRENLQLEAVSLVDGQETVSPPTHSTLQEKLMQAVLELPKPMLIYVQTRVDADELATFLSSKLKATQSSKVVNKTKTVSSSVFTSATHKKMNEGGEGLTTASGEEKSLAIQSYHAALDRRSRTRAQQLFMQDHIDVLVATVAFGMGIDKPNIRSVVHASVPSSIETYVQETGRGGRDGKLTVCRLLYNPYDYFTLRSRLLSSLVSPPEMLSIVHRILSCPVSRVGERLVVVPVSKISEELTLSEETVETVLFMMLSLDRDVLSACHGISPTGYKVIRTSAAVSEADVMQKAGKRKRGEAQAPGVGSTLAQLNVLDDVFEMFLKNKRIECVVTAANGLNMSLHDLDFRMNDLCDTGFVALQRLSPGYVISVGKNFVEATTPLGQQQLASRLWNLHNIRIENLVKSLALTFGVLQRPTHDGVEFGLQYSPSIVPDSLPTQYREAMCWTPPVRSVTKVEAVMIVNDFVEKNRPRINNTYEAARALLGVLPKNLAGRGKYSGEIPLAMCWYVSSPFFGLLREFDMQWILKLLSPHNLDGNVSTSSS